MLTVQEFVQNISEDFKKVFPEVSIENSFIRLGTGLTHVELPINSMYKEYQVYNSNKVHSIIINFAL